MYQFLGFFTPRLFFTHTNVANVLLICRCFCRCGLYAAVEAEVAVSVMCVYWLSVKELPKLHNDHGFNSRDITGSVSRFEVGRPIEEGNGSWRRYKYTLSIGMWLIFNGYHPYWPPPYSCSLPIIDLNQVLRPVELVGIQKNCSWQPYHRIGVNDSMITT